MRLFFELYRQSGLAFSYRRYLAALALAPLATGAARGAAALFHLGPIAAVAVGLMAGLLAFTGVVAHPLHLVPARRSALRTTLSTTWP